MANMADIEKQVMKLLDIRFSDSELTGQGFF